MPTPRKPISSKLLGDMLAFFRSAPPDMIAAAKAVSADQVEDLRDDLPGMSGPAASDIWNGTPPAPQTGATESMSGDGVKPMTGRYSEPSSQSTAGGEFEKLGDRLCSLENTMKSLLSHVFKADVSDEDRFPDSEDKEDEDEIEKGDITKLSVSDLFSVLTNRTNRAAEKALKAQEARDRAVGSPPDMHTKAMMKSAYDLLDEDDSLTMAERVDQRIRMQAMRLRAEGMPVDVHDYRLTGQRHSLTGMAMRG